MGSLDYSLGSLDLWVSSLEYCEVRWFLGQIVGILGSSLDSRLFGHATERNPRKHWNPDPWTDRIARIQ